MNEIGIFTANESFARKWIEAIEHRHDLSSISIVQKRIELSGITVIFSNGDCCKWIKFSPRGQKMTDAIIDIATRSFDEISMDILPSIVDFEREPEIIIADSNPDKKHYDLDTLIDRFKKIRLIKGNLEVVYGNSDIKYTNIEYIDITKDSQLRLM